MEPPEKTIRRWCFSLKRGTALTESQEYVLLLLFMTVSGFILIIRALAINYEF